MILLLCGYYTLQDSHIAAQTSVTGGGLQITITNEQGQKIPGARIQYTRLPKMVATLKQENPASGEAILHGEATADVNGQITAVGLPVGTYALCASAPGAAYLDPCIWQQPVQISVASGAKTLQTVALKKGVFLRVQVDDPIGLLPTTAVQAWARPKLIVGVMYGSGAYQAVREQSIDGTTHTFQLAIPAGTAFSLRLFSTDVALKEANGAAVDTVTGGIPFLTTAEQDMLYSFTVAGMASE